METKKPHVQYFFSNTLIGEGTNLPPAFSEFPTKKWVLYGDRNDYTEYLIELFLRSPTHNAIIKGKHFFINGLGWKFKEEGLTPQQIQIAKNFIDNVNSAGQSLSDVMSRLSLDWLTYGGFSARATTDVITREPKSLYYEDFTRLRIGINEKAYFWSRYWVYDKNGRRVSYLYTPPDKEIIPKFNFNGENKAGASIIYYRDVRPAMEYYPLPEYVAGIQEIETEIGIGEFHNNNIKSGFSAGYIISFNNGVPEPEEQAKIVKELKEQFTSARNAGELMVIFNESKERGVEILPIRPNDIDKQFEVLRKDNMQAIVTVHSITSPMLLGIRTESPFGGREEILENNELFHNKYVKPKQVILEKFANRWFEMCYKFKIALEIIPIETVTQQLTEATLVQILDKNEMREMVGKAPSETAPVTPPATAPVAMNLSANVELLEALKECASDLDGEIIAERTCDADFDFSEEAEQTYLRGFVDLFALDMNQKIVYDILQDKLHAKLTVKEIAAKAALSIEATESALNYLQENNILNYKYIKEGSILNITEINPITPPADSGRPLSELITMYRYQGPNDDRTRPFCRAMLNDAGLKDKLWTRAAINKLSQEENRNVWLTRGGWYTLPNGNHRPSCRHSWLQVVVRKNKAQ